jgi:hypothetical protein
MTAEIAIMNRGAIALAADSAVTLQRPGGSKIYNSVNKLFMLSKYHPVGVMVYGMADFTGVPWETIIKEYRSRLGHRSFPQLRGYIEDFLGFLDPRSGLFSQEEQDRYLRRAVYGCFGDIRKGIDKQVDKAIRDKGSVTLNQIRIICTSVIKSVRNDYDRTPDLVCFQTLSMKALVSKYRKDIDAIRKDVFENLPLSATTQRLLCDVAICIFLKEGFTESTSGVVVAGFGEQELYPSLVCVAADGFLDGQLRRKELRSEHISETNSASIMPFAQSEMVHTFMEGTDPRYKQLLWAYMGKLFTDLPDEILKVLPSLRGKAKEEMAAKLKNSCAKLLEELKNQADEYRRKNHVAPIIEAVTFLPKDELAAMAESLVNLTSFKRRISMDAETVGGPIDVAVISKGDGFIWIKRKHYFKPELNPAFFANYYLDKRSTEEGDKNAKGAES